MKAIAQFTITVVSDGAPGPPGTTGPTGPTGPGALNMILSKDSVSVPCDIEGNVTDFSKAVGIVVVFKGDTDISHSCTYTATWSGLSGTWDASARAYAVTAMSADVGTLEIKATYNGKVLLKALTVTKGLKSIHVDNLSAISANLGEVKAGRITNADGTFEINVNEGTIVSKDFPQTATSTPTSVATMNDGSFIISGKKRDTNRATIQYGLDYIICYTLNADNNYAKFQFDEREIYIKSGSSPEIPIYNRLSTLSTNHNHDARYFTETEVNSKISALTNALSTNHNHDARYYTESEINSKFNATDGRFSNVKKMRVGTSVLKGTGGPRIPLLWNTTVNNLLGVGNSTNMNTTITCSNGDGAATTAQMTCIYMNNGWHVDCGVNIPSGYSVRVNYMVMYWG